MKKEQPEFTLPSPRQELLLRASLLKGDAATDAWNSWKSGIDMETLDHESHQMLPILYRNLTVHGISDPLVSTLKGTHRKTWYRNQVLLNSMKGIVKMFNDSGIETMILKGAALTLCCYKDYGLRPMDDMDILIPVRRAGEGIRLLENQGWFQAHPSRKVYEEGYYSCHNGCHFENREGHQLDLHWHLLHEGCYATADDPFWAESLPVQLDENLFTKRLCPTHQLYHIIVHAMRRNPRPILRWVADARVVLGQPGQIDWDRFLSEATSRRQRLPVKRGLNYLQMLFEQPLPGLALKNINEIRVSRFEYYEDRAQSKAPLGWNILRLTLARYIRVRKWLPLSKRFLWIFRYLQYEMEIKHLWQLPYHILVKGIQVMNR